MQAGSVTTPQPLTYHQQMLPGARRLIELLLGIGLMAQIASAINAPAQSNAAEKPLPAGQIIDSVPCAGDPTQDYALYLPSAYTPAKAWPIIYTFDPLAFGKGPVKLYKDIAEKYGYILAASNQSRNFQTDLVSKAARAVWDDTHTRLTLDSRRIYMMGFSGGARAATMLAIRCQACAVAGVISHGAGYPFPPSDKEHFAYFAFVGDKDFNWSEAVELRRKKEEWGAPYHLRVFDGEHQWAPPAVFEEAIEWLQLKAMQAGVVAPDSSFLDSLFAKTQKDAQNASQQKDAIAQSEAYRTLVSDFSGLKDVTEYQAKLTALKNSADYKQALKKEQEAIDQQRDITQELSSKFARAGDADVDAQLTLRDAIVKGMTELKYQADHGKNVETRLIMTRSFSDLWAQGIEAGQDELETKKHFGKAEFYFQLMRTVSPDDPWPVLLLAESRALRGDKKHALKDLRDAVKLGLKNPDFIRENADLQTLHSEPEFQRMIAELQAKRAVQAPQ
jgi:dienelactone hydrolase